jgi:predicted transposase YdaD
MFDEKLRGKFDEWIYVLKTSKVRDDFTAAGLKEAKAKLDYLSMPPDERLAYERYMDNIRSQNSIVIAAEVRGRAEGRAEGEAAGIEKGRRDVVINMHRAGFCYSDIAKATLLSEQEVKRILEIT